MQLTEHFTLEEFALDGEIPDSCVPVFKALCENLLEPLRVHYGEPIIVTSGYRPPGANAAAHGVSNSQHIATDQYCAADWKIESFEHDMRPVFDLIRQSPQLQFDQLILEHSPESGTDVIHASWSRVHNRREALEGDTANQSAYTPWPAVPGAEGVEA
jgi:zinc D-Ala-D-Ala carboxypeptidase